MRKMLRPWLLLLSLVGLTLGIDVGAMEVNVHPHRFSNVTVPLASPAPADLSSSELDKLEQLLLEGAAAVEPQLRFSVAQSSERRPADVRRRAQLFSEAAAVRGFVGAEFVLLKGDEVPHRQMLLELWGAPRIHSELMYFEAVLPRRWLSDPRWIAAFRRSEHRAQALWIAARWALCDHPLPWDAVVAGACKAEPERLEKVLHAHGHNLRGELLDAFAALWRGSLPQRRWPTGVPLPAEPAGSGRVSQELALRLLWSPKADAEAPLRALPDLRPLRQADILTQQLWWIGAAARSDQVMQALLAAGLDIRALHVSERSSDSVLHTAMGSLVMVGPNTVARLLRAGASPHQPDGEGAPPILAAAYPVRSIYDFPKMTVDEFRRRFQLLLDAGADPGVRDRRGKTAAALFRMSLCNDYKQCPPGRDHLYPDDISD
jgi:hypothetical protein